MPVFEDETREKTAQQPDSVARALDILNQLDSTPETRRCREEGAAICQILEPLSLPPVLNAAVHLYPSTRDGHISHRRHRRTAKEATKESF